MPEFCDVALPVPLDTVFTYRVPADAMPVAGGRVLVPFRQRRMTGIVVELHDRKPSVTTKNILRVLDAAPALDEQLMRLGRWIADYYLAPLGEVFRTMLPLGAEFKRTIGYRITEEGQMALHLAGMSGSPARSRLTPDEQAAEFRVLDYLAARASETRSHDTDANGKGTASLTSAAKAGPPGACNGTALMSETTLRSATRSSRPILNGMVRKKWLVREDLSAPQEATRTVKIALLKSAEGKLNENQRRLVDTLAASGGRVPVDTLQSLEVPRTTLKTLTRRGLLEIAEEPADFFISHTKPRPSPFEFDFNSAQQSALARRARASKRTNFPACCSTALPARGKLLSTWRACALCSKPDGQPFCWFQKSA